MSSRMNVLIVGLIIMNLCKSTKGGVCPDHCRQDATCPDSDCPYGECKPGWWGLKCEFPLECHIANNFDAYRGTKNVSKGNLPCLDWIHFPDKNPGDGLVNASNYCRKADYDNFLWCFVSRDNATKPRKWRKCNIPICADQCPPPNIPQHTFVTPPKNGFTVDSHLEVGCGFGYRPIGVRHITCMRNKQWQKIENCEDINECDQPSKCRRNAVCTNTEGSYRCSCKEGYTKPFCYDIDECNEYTPCGANQWCRNTPGSYKCPCRRGYMRGTNASCIPVACSGFGTHGENVHVVDERDSYEYWDTVTFVCDPGYETYRRTNTTVLICEHDGTWSAAVPTCKVRCPSQCDPRSDCSQSADHACPYRKCNPGWWGRYCQHPLECHIANNFDAYRGTKNVSKGNVPCLDWIHFPDKNPGDGRVNASNYCRKADNDDFLWCFVSRDNATTPRKWRKCTIPICADQCPPPNIPQHTFVTPPKNGFTVDSHLEVGCGFGYRPIGVRHITCMRNKQWQKIENCEAVACSGFGTHGENVHVVDERDAYEYGDTATFVCDPGYETYRRTNVTVLTCEHDGTWSAAVPTCKVRCPSQCDPRSDCSQSKDHACPYRKCNPGWWGRYCQHRHECLPRDELHYYGTKNITRSGISCDRWDAYHTHSVGVLKQLSNDPSPENFCRHADDTSGVWCYTYIITNKSMRWERCDVQRCDEQCEPPDTNIYSFIEDPPLDGFTVGGNITISCDDGYALSGSSTLTCLHNTSYEWSASAPVCKEICPTPTPSLHSYIVNANKTYVVGDTVNITCDPGYEIHGNKTIMCLNTRNWSHPVPTCTATCDLPVTRPHSFITNKAKIYRYGDVIEVECESGYETLDQMRLKCKDDRSWSSDMPVCLDVNECNKTTPCGANAVCRNTEGSFQCFCPKGYIRDSDTACREPDYMTSSLIVGVAVGSILILMAVILMSLFFVRKRHHAPTKYDSCAIRYIAGKDNSQEVVNLAQEWQVDPTNEEDTGAYANVPEEDEAVNVYYEISPYKKPSVNAVSEENFKEYVTNKMKDMSSLFTEYASLDTGFQNTSTVSMIPENKSKKRDHEDIYPYDKNRVKLAPWDDEDHSDYINASYIDGAVKYRKYIASEGPLKTSVEDFWRMIWEQDMNCVVMLTNIFEDGEKMCEQYWPSQKGSTTFGNIEVTLIEEYVLSGFIRRKMSLMRNGERRALTQFHFTEWPEKGVPRLTSSLVNLRSKILKLPGVDSAPLLVHCSTGVGRTGTFIAFDYLLEQAETTGYIDVKNCVQILGEQRMKMVQTKEQYVFLHQVVLDALSHHGKQQCSLTGNKSTFDQQSQEDCNDKYQNIINGQGYVAEKNTQLNSNKYQKLILGHDNSPRQHDNIETYQRMITGCNLEHIYDDLQYQTKGKGNTASNKPENIKNSNIVPGSGTGSIETVYLASSTGHTIFITLQTPLSNAVTDFWKLVYEQKTSSIVMLNDLTDESCAIYWPVADEQVQFGSFSITLTETSKKSFGKVCRFLLKRNEEDRVVTQYRCAIWPDSSVIPTSTLPILDLIRTVQEEKDEGPVIVHCKDGATKCGVYCTVAAAMQEMETEHEMDIPPIIQRFRLAKPQIIKNLEQFRFCYDVMTEYLNMFGIYENN